MNIKQRSKEWYDLRRTKICSSDAGVILGANRWKTPYDLLMEKLGIKEEDPISPAMQRGIDLEDQALECFFQKTGIFTLPQCIIPPENDFMMSSLDGMSLDGQKIVECKCPGKTAHEQAKKGKIPSYNYPQLQHHLAVTNLPMIYYFSYDGENGVVIEVERNDTYIKHMIEKEKEFFQALLMFVDNNDVSKYYNPQPY